MFILVFFYKTLCDLSINSLHVVWLIGYRRIPGDVCEGGMDHLYEVDIRECPPDNKTDFIIYSTGTNIYKWVFSAMLKIFVRIYGCAMARDWLSIFFNILLFCTWGDSYTNYCPWIGVSIVVWHCNGCFQLKMWCFSVYCQLNWAFGYKYMYFQVCQ